jgi:hypothetical protein
VKISGVAILRNVVRLDYPFVESLSSLLPLVDELVVAVGDGDDGTWEAVQAIGDSRLKPFRTAWASTGTGGELLSQQTNLALARCTGDWAMYLQADELLHEDDLERVRAAMQRHQRRTTEGLVFRYHHFWSGYSLVADDWFAFYPRAVRAVKLGMGVESVGDACGFVRRNARDDRGLIKADSGAHIYHYGWCNPPEQQLTRMTTLRSFYAGRNDLTLSPADVFAAQAVRTFAGTHPRVMRARIAARPVRAARGRHAFWPAASRAVGRLLRDPRGVRGWARPLLPLRLTNVWWRAVDLKGRIVDR